MSLNKNNLALIYTGILLFGFFISGIFDVLDYFIIKVFLFTGFAVLVFVVILIAFKELDSK